MERLHRKGQDHLPNIHTAHYPKPKCGGAVIRGKKGNSIMTLCEFIAKIAALVPPRRMRRHRYFGVLAPNSPFKSAVTAMAPMPEIPHIALLIEAV